MAPVLSRYTAFKSCVQNVFSVLKDVTKRHDGVESKPFAPGDCFAPQQTFFFAYS